MRCLQSLLNVCFGFKGAVIEHWPVVILQKESDWNTVGGYNRANISI